MIHEKSTGSVWNVALVAIAVALGAMAMGGLVSAGNANTAIVAAE